MQLTLITQKPANSNCFCFPSGLSYQGSTALSLAEGKFKVLLTKAHIVTSCSCRCKSLNYFTCHGLFTSLKNAFGSYLLIFKSALAIWLCSFNFTDLWRALYRWRCEHPIEKSLDNVNFSWKNFKFATLIKFYP